MHSQTMLPRVQFLAILDMDLSYVTVFLIIKIIDPIPVVVKSLRALALCSGSTSNSQRTLAWVQKDATNVQL